MPDTAKGVPLIAACHRPLPWIVDAGAGDFDEDRVHQPGARRRRSVGAVVRALPGGEPAARAARPGARGTIRLVKVNVDQAPAVQARFGVQGIPTFVLLRDGREVGRLVGAHPVQALRQWIESGLGGR